MPKYVPNKSEALIKEFEGFVIVVDLRTGTFLGYNEEEEHYSEKSLDELEAVLKLHSAQHRKFKPLDVIQISSDKLGKITSRDAKHDNYVNFSYPDDYNKGRSAHCCESLGNSSYGHNFVVATPANLKIRDQILALSAKINELHQMQTALRKTYQDKVTWDCLELAINPKPKQENAPS